MSLETTRMIVMSSWHCSLLQVYLCVIWCGVCVPEQCESLVVDFSSFGVHGCC